MNSKMVQADRVNELLGLLGLGPVQLAAIVKLTPSSISQWRSGKTVPDRSALVTMASRWHLSIDSLVGLAGTRGLEPAPSLQIAQTLAADEMVKGGAHTGTPSERLVLLYRFFSANLPGFTLEEWAEYLKCDPDRWITVETGFREASTGQLRGAAFFAGWRNEATPWEAWLTLGDIGPLQGPSLTAMQRAFRTLHTRGGGLSHILKAVDTLENK